MTRQVVGIEPFPEYLDNVEWLIGDMPFFSNPDDAAMARISPGQLDRETLIHRHELYSTILGEVAAAHGVSGSELLRQPGALDDAWEDIHGGSDEFRAKHEQLIGRARGELMEADHNLKSASVIRLEEALAALPHTDTRTAGSHRTDRSLPSDVLPAYMTTLRSVGRILDTTRGTARIMLHNRHIEPARLRLPSSANPESVLPWTLVHLLGERVGFLADVKIDLSKLPADQHDRNQAHIAHARELQRRFVPLYKLIGTEAVTAEEFDYMNTPAASYQVSINQLERLLGGGYHFIEDRLAKEGLVMACRRRHDGNFGFYEYMTKEQAAKIWDEYNAIPVAVLGFTSIARIAEQANVSRGFINSSITSEEVAQIQQMRSNRPAGRVLQHVPDETAQSLLERYTRKVLPPNRVPINKLSQYLGFSYSNIMHRLEKTPIVIPKLFLQGAAHKQSCVDWPTVRYLETIGGLRPGVEPIDYDKLPIDEDDMTPGKLAYSRQVQLQLGLATSVGEDSSETYKQPANERMAFEEIPRLNELDVQTRAEIAELSQETKFTQKAVVRLLVERGHTIGHGCSETGLPILQKIRRLPGTTNIQDVQKVNGMSTKEALDFLRRYRGKFMSALDEEGNLGIFVERISKEMLIRQQNRRENIKVAPLDWVHVGQILAGVDATFEEFDNWAKDHVRDPKDQDWMISKDDVVLPHYSLESVAPFIVKHKRINRGGIQGRQKE
jgi:hypothetical protein